MDETIAIHSELDLVFSVDDDNTGNGWYFDDHSGEGRDSKSFSTKEKALAAYKEDTIWKN